MSRRVSLNIRDHPDQRALDFLEGFPIRRGFQHVCLECSGPSNLACVTELMHAWRQVKYQPLANRLATNPRALPESTEVH